LRKRIHCDTTQQGEVVAKAVVLMQVQIEYSVITMANSITVYLLILESDCNP